VSAPYPPESVGRAAGLPVPARLPMIGTKVVDHDGTEGLVAHYQFHDPDQRWFPVTFVVAASAITRSRRLEKNASSCRGYVRLAETPTVTPLDTARKPVPEPPAHAVAADAVAS
jgi:hypothetical protein